MAPDGTPPTNPGPIDPSPATVPGFLPRSPEGWLLLVGGIACIGYGAYAITRELLGNYVISTVSVVVLALGGMIIPLRWVGMAVGIALIGLAVFMLATGYGGLSVLIVGVLGLFGVAERWRRIKAL